MALPTGSGSELLRRGIVEAQADSATSLLFTGLKTAVAASGNSVPTNHIVTIINVTFCNTEASNSLAVDLYITGESITVYLLKGQSITAGQTFVFSDRFVLKAGDNLQVDGTGSGTVDVLYSFIDQNWID